MSRVTYLLDIRHEHLEAPNEAWDRLTFTQLVERQLVGGEIELAIFNLSSQIADNFEVAVLYWGQGDLAKAEFYLRQTLERHERRRLAAIAHDAPYPPKHHSGDAYAKIAAILLDEPLDGAALLSAADTTTGIIADPQSARRFIDICLGRQCDSWDGTPRDAVRPVREAGKVAKAMKDLGWDRDRAALDLMRAYRMDAILNDSTHIHLADPLGQGHMGLKGWTQLLRDTFGLHPDFIPIAQSEERADWSDPQGAWYVLWKKDRRIYAVQREDWHDPAKATASARPGKELWPSYVSFVAWWAGEHRDFRP